MSTARRSRTLAAAPQRVWEVVNDAHHIPRWWPGVARVEGVDADRFTKVFMTKRGKPVRADFHVVELEPPWRVAWEQELVGTPFERLLAKAVTEIRLEPDQDGTRVTLELRQKLRGYSRLGGFMLKRATRAKLDEALDGLAAICV
jgi:uncharacterized protein YndB with AHSA1/START domain